MNFVSKSWCADALFDATCWRHCLTKSLNAPEKFWFSGSVGGGEFDIRTITSRGYKFAYGAEPVASSIAVIPRDQISAFSVYPIPAARISGAI